MSRARGVACFAAAMLAVGCPKTSDAPAPDEPAVQEPPDDGSDLSEFRKARKKGHSHKKSRFSNPPTRAEGQAALVEGRELVEEADFRSAESDLRVAAAAGIDGADALLLRVRREIAAEDAILAAQRKLADKDYSGARTDLRRVGAGLILSDLSRQMIGKLDQRDADARKELLAKATQKFDPDASVGSPDAQADTPKPP